MAVGVERLQRMVFSDWQTARDPVDVRADEHDRHVRPAARIENVDGAQHVDVVEITRLLPAVRNETSAGKMNDAFDAVQAQGTPRDVAVGAAVRDDMPPLSAQRLHQVRADESGRAGHEYAVSHDRNSALRRSNSSIACA